MVTGKTITSINRSGKKNGPQVVCARTYGHRRSGSDITLPRARTSPHSKVSLSQAYCSYHSLTAPYDDGTLTR